MSEGPASIGGGGGTGGISTLLARYRERMQHEHGWEVEVRCPTCGAVTVPTFRGWTPGGAINFGDRPTIYANLECPRCGADLKAAAGETLVELFGGVPIPTANRRLMGQFITLWVGLPLLLIAVPLLAALAGSQRPMGSLVWATLLIGLSIMWFNWQVHSIRFRCECGQPTYKFMGLLGRSYCYRCSTCGRLLRLRD